RAGGGRRMSGSAGRRSLSEAVESGPRDGAPRRPPGAERVRPGGAEGAAARLRWLRASRRGRLALLILGALILVGLAVWRAPSLGHALGVLARVSVGWLVAAVAVNLVSIGLRTAAWWGSLT